MAPDLWERIQSAEIASGTVAMWWLLQAGFVFKTSAGTVLLIDPYLSDSAEDIYGLARAHPTPMDAARVAPDAVLATHWHEDHLDPGSILPLAQASEAIFIGPPSCQARVIGRGVDLDRTIALRRGEHTRVGEVDITATFVRHEVPGYVTEDAVGYLLDFGGDLRIYHSGDADYDARLLSMRDQEIDVALLCTNGSGGNMNAHEAALLAWQLGAPVVVPMHFGLWADEGYGPGATLDPGLFEITYRNLGGSGTVLMPQLGDAVTLPLV